MGIKHEAGPLRQKGNPPGLYPCDVYEGEGRGERSEGQPIVTLEKAEDYDHRGKGVFPLRSDSPPDPGGDLGAAPW